MTDSYNALKTADYSPLLVHLVRDGNMASPSLIADSHPLHPIKTLSAKARLEAILTSRTIHGSPMPWLPDHPEAVCFTECVWQGLVRHTSTFSCYGIVFNKKTIFDKGGGPALYVRGDHLNSHVSALPSDQQVFVTPFDPEGKVQSGVPLDFLHEREWRLPGSLSFDYSDVQFVLVDSWQDAHDLLLSVGAQHLNRSQIISMETHRVITQAWGQA